MIRSIRCKGGEVADDEESVSDSTDTSVSSQPPSADHRSRCDMRVHRQELPSVERGMLSLKYRFRLPSQGENVLNNKSLLSLTTTIFSLNLIRGKVLPDTYFNNNSCLTCHSLAPT